MKKLIKGILPLFMLGLLASCNIDTNITSDIDESSEEVESSEEKSTTTREPDDTRDPIDGPIDYFN